MCRQLRSGRKVIVRISTIEARAGLIVRVNNVLKFVRVLFLRLVRISTVALITVRLHQL